MTIRDPSDGTTYDPPKGKPVIERPVLDTDTTGLPAGSTKSKDVVRLEKSKEWLRDYKLGLFHHATAPALAPIGQDAAEDDAP